MTLPKAELFDLCSKIGHGEFSGGLYTTHGNKMMLVAIALTIHAKDILELGYDAGATTLALAMTGANVVGVDNGDEYPEVKVNALERMKDYPNVTLCNMDALLYLQKCEDSSFDLIFIDDWHDYTHVLNEAAQARRVVRPGGFVCLHDTIVHGLWGAIEEIFPDWQRIEMPSIQDGEMWQGVERYRGQNFGFGMVRRPEETVL